MSIFDRRSNSERLSYDETMVKMLSFDKNAELDIDRQFTGFTSSDTFISAIMPWSGRSVSLGMACLFSYSSHRDKYQVTSMNSVKAKGFTNGHRSIVGNLGFRIMDKKIIQNLCSEYSTYMGMPTRARLDELPPFTLLVSKYNELNAWKCIVVNGCCFQDDGKTLQIDDVMLSWVTSFQALSIEDFAGYGPYEAAVDKIIADSASPSGTEVPPAVVTPPLATIIPLENTQLLNPYILSDFNFSTMESSNDGSAYNLVNAFLGGYIGTTPKVVGYSKTSRGSSVNISSRYNNILTPGYSYFVPFSDPYSTSGYIESVIQGITFEDNWMSSDLTRSVEHALDLAEKMSRSYDQGIHTSIEFNTGEVAFNSKVRSNTVMGIVLNNFLHDPSGTLRLMGDWEFAQANSVTGSYYEDGSGYYSQTSGSIAPSYFSTVPYSGKWVYNKMSSIPSDYLNRNPYGNPFLFNPTVLTSEIGVLNFGKNSGYGYSSSSEEGMVIELIRMASEVGKDTSEMYNVYKTGNIGIPEVYAACKAENTSFKPLNGRRTESDFCYAAFWLMVNSAKIAGYNTPFEDEVLSIVPTKESVNSVAKLLAKDLTPQSLLILGLDAVDADSIEV